MHYPHVAHFAGNDETALIDGVARYLRTALDSEGCALVVTSVARRDRIDAQLGKPDRVTWIDGHQILALIHRDGKIDANAFRNVVGRKVRETIKSNGARPLYAYGDMVGTLWEGGHHAAAIQLERLWNDLGSSEPFRLYCAYPIDANECTHPHVQAVIDLHSELVA